MRQKHKHIKKILFYILLFSGLGIFSYYLMINLGHLSSYDKKELRSPFVYLFIIIIFNLSGFIILKLSQWIDSLPFPYSFRKFRLPVMYLLLTVILLFINYGILLIAKLLIDPHSYHIFPNGGYRILIAVWLIEIVVVVLVLANRTAEKAILLQRKTALLQQENDTAKYEALQNQLNPHFLFNSLNTLVAEIEYNPKNAVKFTRVLSEVYRYVMQSQQLRTVTLKDEISFLESFIYLHTVRLGDCIIIENHINDSADDIRLAPLSLQLLAENVIKHNVINEDEPMTITLSLDNTGQYLVFENNLRKKLSGSENGIGLKNLSNRYMLLCGKDIIVKSDTKDNKFRVEIPLIYE